jgi:hypothetical protein
VRRAALLVLLALLAAPARADEGPVEVAAWQAASTSERWALFEASVEADPRKEAAWLDWLAARCEDAFLEQIALYRSPVTAVEKLYDRKAPHRTRVAVWSIRSVDSHAVGGAGKRLESEPGVTLAWLARHPEAAVGPVAAVRDRLAKDHRPTSAEGLLPPLDPEVVLAALATDADPAATARALAGLVLSTHREDVWRGRVRRLLGHADAGVRRHAWLALVGLPHEWADVAGAVRLLDDPEETREVREAALLVLAGHPHPTARLALYDRAASPASPLFATAVLGLVQSGDLFAEDLLGALELSGEADRARDEALAMASEQRSSLDASRLAAILPAWIERVAFAEQVASSYAEALRVHLEEIVRPWADEPDVRRALADLRRDYAGGPGIPPEVVERVRARTDALLAR